MIYAWILVFCVQGHHECSTGIIENIATQSECQRVASVLNETSNVRIIRCMEVGKSK